MPRRRPDIDIPADLSAALEDGVKRILKSPKSTPQQISQAVSAGVKLLELKRKVSSDDDKSGGFFSQ